MARTVGLIGGLALRAGIFYYEQLARHSALRQEPLHLLLSHADVNRVLAHVSANEPAALGLYLGGLANQLFSAGADLVAITAVAPHLAIQETTRIAAGPVVNLLDTVAAGLASAGLQRVAIFGNRSVMETRLFGTVLEEHAVTLDASQIKAVHTLYTDIALHGKRASTPEIDHLRQIARDLIDRCGAQAILLAGTDLSSFYAEQKPDFPFLDIAQLHLEEIVKRMQQV